MGADEVCITETAQSANRELAKYILTSWCIQVQLNCWNQSDVVLEYLEEQGMGRTEDGDIPLFPIVFVPRALNHR